MSKTDPINPNVPAGSEDPKLGDNRIRALARAVAEILNVDHYVGSDGGSGYSEDAAGEHGKVTLRNTTAPSAEAAKGKLYVVSGELYYKDPGGNQIQLTNGGILNSLNLTGDQTIAGTKTFSAQAAFAAGLTAAAALVSTLATGTAPLTVASTTKVTNLNADKWDGKDLPAYSGGQSFTIVATPNDVIIKMGSTAISGTSGTVTFSEAFPNDCVVAVVCGGHSTDGTLQTVQSHSFTKTGFGWHSGNGANLTPMRWIAIGY